MAPTPRRRFDATWLPFGMMIGVVVGIGTGLEIFGNIFLGAAFGFAVGAGIGILLGFRMSARRERDEDIEDLRTGERIPYPVSDPRHPGHQEVSGPAPAPAAQSPTTPEESGPSTPR